MIACSARCVCHLQQEAAWRYGCQPGRGSTVRAAQQAELPFQPSQLPVSLPQRCAGPGLPSGPPPAQQQCKCSVWLKQSKGCQSDMAYQVRQMHRSTEMLSAAQKLLTSSELYNDSQGGCRII